MHWINVLGCALQCTTQYIQNSPSGIGQYSVMLSIPVMVLLGISLLMVNTGIPLALVLGTLLAVFGTLDELWRVNMNTSYENGWGLLEFLSIPLWAICGLAVSLFRFVVN